MPHRHQPSERSEDRKQNGRIKFSPGAPVDRSKVVEARPVIKHHAAALDDITLTHCQRLRHANISGAVVLRVDVRSRVRTLNSIARGSVASSWPAVAMAKTWPAVWLQFHKLASSDKYVNVRVKRYGRAFER